MILACIHEPVTASHLPPNIICRADGLAIKLVDSCSGNESTCTVMVFFIDQQTRTLFTILYYYFPINCADDKNCRIFLSISWLSHLSSLLKLWVNFGVNFRVISPDLNHCKCFCFDSLGTIYHPILSCLHGLTIRFVDSCYIRTN